MNLSIFWLSFLLPFFLSAQVVNNDIEKRLKLPVNSSLISNTTNCTVQWNCVDAKAVTGCIQFHNDQWFEFTTAQAGQYFISVTNQQCRDVRGVQLLVIDGDPCMPSTYKNIVCYSTGSQDDIALPLDNLQANHTYLINIDGYLNDFCQFEISLTTHAPDFVLFPLPEPIEVTSRLTSKVVQLAWVLSDSLVEQISEFTILRRHASEKRTKQIANMSASANTHGLAQSAYSRVDTLDKEGVYVYKIIAITNLNRKYLLKELKIHYDTFNPSLLEERYNQILPMDLPKKIQATLFIYNAATNELLEKRDRIIKRKEEVKLNLYAYMQAGIHTFKVLVKETGRGEGFEKEFLFTK
ncbi:hypothetical protein Q0590_36075 [Rhodocytophaga aerolata]|uniref:T9SS type A sorting domain-containing protein n=1 Tax=Rhodocytophaga aerolata TaxID=455078 RepID=A0ABT8RK82_9BACT|nr:hypothetical protein [Rhodocytophaga aerolata]MDO1451748.1 hypothetical protein [Rhodocytophaga aerolata]